MEQLLLNVALCIDILCQCSELANNIIVLLGQSHGTVLGLRFIVFHLWCPYFLCVNYGIVVIYLVLFVSKLMLPDFSYNYPSSSSSSPFYFCCEPVRDASFSVFFQCYTFAKYHLFKQTKTFLPIVHNKKSFLVCGFYELNFKSKSWQNETDWLEKAACLCWQNLQYWFLKKSAYKPYVDKYIIWFFAFFSL